MKDARIAVFLSLAFALASAGCQKQEPEAGQPAKNSAQHAAADVKPGSHEDWCGEHGLPASQCLLCTPHLEIERPPRTGAP
jgi:hypothetical protein